MRKTGVTGKNVAVLKVDSLRSVVFKSGFVVGNVCDSARLPV